MECSFRNHNNEIIMGVLKLSILEEKNKELREKKKVLSKRERIYHISACGCPCECFIKKGDIIMWDDDDDVASTASWNID